MKAAVFHKLHDIRCENVEDPYIQDPRDAIVRVTSTSISGSDLHIYNGYFAQMRHMILGHEFVGVVEEVGPNVKNLKKGDRVVVPFPIACGRCYFCQVGAPTACENSNRAHYGPQGGVTMNKGGGLFGYTDLYGGYNGGQAEAVRVPYADYGPRLLPDFVEDHQALALTDILPAGWAAVEMAQVQPGESVAVFGCGPVGLMTMKCALAKGAGRIIAVDVLPERLKRAEELCRAETVNASEVNSAERIIALTQGHGADVSVDAVGLAVKTSLLEKAVNVVHLQSGSSKVVTDAIHATRRGGRISILGVYSTTYDNFPLGPWMDKGLRIWAGQVPVHNYIDELLKMLIEKKIRTDDVITHTLKLDEVSQAYQLANRKEQNCLKVVLKP